MDESVKFGVLIPIPAAPVDTLIKIAKRNEEAGFDSIWASDHLLMIPTGIVPEAWSVLTAIAMVTDKVMLGTCVSDPHRQHPAVLAQRIATIDHVSKGRVILGMGVGEAMNLDPFGIEWDRPISRLIEAVKIMRKLWTEEERFGYNGIFWELRDAFLQIRPARSRVPIYFAANSPRMLRLTGEMADGWIPVPMTPKLYRERLKLVKEGAEKAGRFIDEIDAGIFIYTAIADKAEDAYKQLDPIRPQIMFFPKLLEEAGYEVEIPKEISPMFYKDVLPTREGMEMYERYGKLVPREAAIDFSIAGTTEDCISKIDELIKAGVRHFILINMGPNPRHVMKMYCEEIIPHFKESAIL
ncbi:MAG: LLM class flavin-dependent oxidoreductase [Candidatus Bathyarchaeia archaeon]